jgi:hypothetical protein
MAQPARSAATRLAEEKSGRPGPSARARSSTDDCPPAVSRLRLAVSKTSSVRLSPPRVQPLPPGAKRATISSKCPWIASVGHSDRSMPYAASTCCTVCISTSREMRAPIGSLVLNAWTTPSTAPEKTPEIPASTPRRSRRVASGRPSTRWTIDIGSPWRAPAISPSVTSSSARSRASSPNGPLRSASRARCAGFCIQRSTWCSAIARRLVTSSVCAASASAVAVMHPALVPATTPGK